MNDYLTQEDDPGPYDVNPDHEAEDVARDARREAFIAGLRDLADCLETHPTLPAPYQVQVNAFVDTRAALATIVRAGHWEKHGNDSYFWVRRSFGEAVVYDVNVNRDQVCRKVVTGTRVIPATAEVIVPATVERIEDVYEWICDEPVLALAGQ